LRREHGLEPTDRALRENPSEGGQIAGQSLGALLHAAVRRDLRHLAAEVEKSFSYAIDAYPNASPSHLLLAGTAAQWRGLDGLLGELLGIQVQVADPAKAWPPAAGCQECVGGTSSLVRALGLVVPKVTAA
jgi:Tfp pilus assembly PilM family ATPase